MMLSEWEMKRSSRVAEGGVPEVDEDEADRIVNNSGLFDRQCEEDVEE